MSDMNEVIMATAYMFDNVEELVEWASHLDILHFPCIQTRIEDLESLEDSVIVDNIDEIDNMVAFEEPITTQDLKFIEAMDEKAKTKEYRCGECSRVFNKKGNLNRHIQSIHQKKSFHCNNCEKSFPSNFNKIRHQTKCTGPSLKLRTFECNQCKATFTTIKNLQQHFRIHSVENEQPTKRRRLDETSPPETTFEPTPGHSRDQRETTFNKTFKCTICNDNLPDRKTLYKHQMRHKQEGSGISIQNAPFTEEQAPWRQGGDIDEAFREAYDVNSPLILETNKPGIASSTFNVPLGPDFSINQLLGRIEEIYEREEQSFRINFSFGLILRNVETGEYRYFRPYGNETLFDQPLLINKRRDINRKLRLRLEILDLVEYMLRQRENSKWKPVFITNVHIFIYRTNFPLGAGNTVLPQYIRENRNIRALVNKQNGTPYSDNLCLFRCLATHKGQQKMETAVRQYYRKWTAHLKESDLGDFTLVDPSNYTGVNLNEISEFEHCFNIGINIFKIDEDGTVLPVFRSTCRFSDIMNLNLFENHLSYITNIRAYSKKFQCETCEKLFSSSFKCLRHQRTCSQITKTHLPGGYYKMRDSLFDELEVYDIIVPAERRHFPWFIVYDLEAMLKPDTSNKNTGKLTWTREHVPISVSVSSNVRDFNKPKCFIDANLDNLIKSMISYIENISSKVKLMAEEMWSDVISKLRGKISACDEEEIVMKNIYGDLLGKTLGYCQQTPVLGFNSSKYDLNLVKRKIALHLGLHDSTKRPFTVKKCNAYSCLSTNTLKFLDVSNYLAPGSSYAKFLKAYGVQEQKGYFPYEWFDCEEKLDEKVLPSHQHFYSVLKNKNISPEEYSFCQKIWQERQMETFRDFLTWYNNLDVGPFVSAVQKLQTFYFDKGIDIFKETMSVPGIARQMLFASGRKAGVTFSLFHKQDEELFQTVRNNIVGGPSIIFNRYSKAGETFIRENLQKPCRKIVGYDANALYLWALGQAMPVGPYIHREKDSNFRPILREKYMSAFHWLDYLSMKHNIKITHKLNNNHEKRIGPYPVDGYCSEINTVFQFHGCYFHGHHNCPLTKNISSEKWKKEREKKYKRTEETTLFLQSRGYKVVEMWECDFCEMKRQDVELVNFIKSRQPQFYRKHTAHVSEEQILKSVRTSEFFGMVEVDIEVPEQWSQEFRYNQLAPREYFAEMSPLFCTTEVPYEVIGSHMQEHVRKHSLSKKPRTLLVGGYKAERILLSSPLLKWYLDHGMRVSKIYQAVEYSSDSPFSEFVEDVSHARRMGDRDSRYTIIADTFKLIGNSGYGGLIMDKTKHRTISYLQGHQNISKLVNSKQFRNLTCLDEDSEYYEVEMSKNKIRFDLPIQLGFFILQYAKLRMLQFYYDFMDKYVERGDYEYCEMDTDSAYMAISGQTLKHVIKPTMKSAFLRDLNGYCRDDAPTNNVLWFPRECCLAHAKYDKRTPGLFKLEYEGDEIVGLCSKTYIVSKTIQTQTPASVIAAYSILRKSKKLPPKRLQPKKKTITNQKFSCKGISKANIRHPLQIYRKVLKTQLSETSVNCGFRARNNTMFSYNQERNGFSYFYCKREVLADGIHTRPLDVVLKPVNKTRKTDEELGVLTNEDKLIARYMVECMEDVD